MTLPALLRSSLKPLAAAIALPAAAPGVDAPPCPGCEAPIAGRFCGACGEPRLAHDLSLGALAAAGIEHLTSLDARLLRTARVLVTRPGFLTAEYRRGVRARYTRPLQLFLLVTALFLVAMPYTGAHYNTRAILSSRVGAHALRPEAQAIMRRTGEGEDAFIARFERRTDDVKRGLLALFVPALAGALALLYARRQRFVVEHFVFATHVFSFLLVLLLACFGVVIGLEAADVRVSRWAGRAPSALTGDVVAGILLAGVAVALWYVWAALRRSYGDGRVAAAVRAALLGAGLLLGAAMYEAALFRLTLALM